MSTRENYAELQTRILDARRVWKRSLFWTGAAIVLIGFLAILVGESIVDWLMPLPSVVRIALLAGIVGATLYLLYKYLIQPMRASLTLRDVALNVEESHPNLEDRLVSAVQFGDRESNDPVEAHMLQRLLEDTTQRIKGIDFKATIDHSRTRKYVGIATLVIAACGLLTLLFPTETHTSLMRIFAPWEKTDPILTTKVNVTPGDARILSGKSLPIEVTVTGKDAEKVVLTYYSKDMPPTAENAGSKQEINMVQNPEDKRGFAYEIFNVDADMEYYVVANETTSERYTVEVFEMPRVEEISVAYTYPEYTNLKPVVQQGSGDIQAVVGTTAELRITANKAIQTATLTHQNSESEDVTEAEVAAEAVTLKSSEMVIADGNILTKTLEVSEDGKYTVELLCIDGFNNEVPIEYTIKAMPDNAPEVVIKEPGRDVNATKLEEVKIVAEATDDYGVEQFNLMYRIGAGELKELALESISKPVAEGADVRYSKHNRVGTYTFYLEEFDVEPGEVISYYAHATDNNTLTGPGEASSEIYFIEVAPFNRRLEEGGECEVGTPNPFLALIASQKQVIRETWKHINAEPSTLTEEYTSVVKKTGEKQGEVKDRTQRVTDELSADMQELQVDPEIMMNLEEAIDKMDEAKGKLDAIQPQVAIPPEQAALELLIKVNLEIPKVLNQARQSEPGLAENFELELEELQNELEQNQEELERELQEQTQQMLDQAREMLAQQQGLNQQSQQMSKENQPSPSDMQQNSQQQGQLSQQAQQMSEQLGQMQGNAQGTQEQRLGQAGQAMQQAGEQMQQASQGMQQQQPQMSAAKGEKAEERLEQAIDQLERASAEFTDNALERASQQLQQLTAEQSDVQQQTQELQKRSEQSGMRPEDYRQASELANQQRQLQQDLESAENNLSNLQQQLSQENPEASQNVSDASRRLSEEQTAEDMATAQRALQWRSLQSADLNQQEVIETLEQAQADLQQARANMAQTEEEQLEAALEQLQSFEEQMQDMQRESQAMEGQEQTEEQQQREQQLAEQQQQLLERMQQAQQAMENAQQGQQPGQEGQEGQQPGQEGQQPGQEGQQPGQEGQQPGQQGQGENENDLARGGAESYQEIKELWLGMLDAMQTPPGNRSRPAPKYELVIRDLQKLESAIEERLNMLQEIKQLAQVAKEDVPPEYRRLVDNYYESLAK
ncbi:hypothetical protein J4G08_16955 [Candidatus Poribacteria bacterium]|nr:hypothetical protein [Candidatus Poribacteria bacterium]